MKITISPTESAEVKRSPAVDYVMKRLVAKVPDYMVGKSDFAWLNEVNKAHGKKPMTNKSMVDAVKRAIDEFYANAAYPDILCDPWEMLIDAGICNTKCEPL